MEKGLLVCCLGVYLFHVSCGSSWLFYRCSRARRVSTRRRRPASSRATSCVRQSLRTCWVRSRRILWRKPATITFISASTHCWFPTEDPFPWAFHKGPPALCPFCAADAQKADIDSTAVPDCAELCVLYYLPLTFLFESFWVIDKKTKQLWNVVSLMQDPSSECWMFLNVLGDVIVGIQHEAVLELNSGRK